MKWILLIILVISSLSFAQEKINIAVLDLEARGGITTREAQRYKDRVTRWLVADERFNVADRKNLDKIIEEQKLQLTGVLDDSKMVEMGELIGVQQIISGNLNTDEENRFVTLKLIDVETGKLIRQNGENQIKQWNDDVRTFENFIFSTIGYLMNGLFPKEAKAPQLSKEVSGIRFGVFTDLRDGKVYKTVTIGSQTWMAENLKYEGIDEDNYIRGTGLYSPKWYGLYYNWEGAQEACPEGWHVPEENEFERLINDISDEYGPFERGEMGLFFMSKEGWENTKYKGKDLFGFSAVGAGRYYWKRFTDLHEDAYFWTSSKGGTLFSSFGICYNIDGYYNSFNKGTTESYDDMDDYYISVRCIKNK